MSLEKLDRASPDLWPEQSEYFSCRCWTCQHIVYNISYMLASDKVPGVHEFVAQNSPQMEPCFWTASLSSEDVSQLHRELQH